MARTIVPRFKRNKKVTWLKVELPAELKIRFDVIVAKTPDTSLKSLTTAIVEKFVDAEEARMARLEEKRAKEVA